MEDVIFIFKTLLERGLITPKEFSEAIELARIEIENK